MGKKTVKDINVACKKVFVRCDFNVPLDEEGNIRDNKRIVAALPTIKYLIEHEAKVILASHLGRPKGMVNPEFSLKPVAAELSKQLGFEVKLANDIVGESAKALVNSMREGEVVLLENVRFDAREEENDEEFAKELASLAEIYVDDAFGSAHRAHASTEGIAHYLPAVSGFLMEKELEFLGSAVENPVRPFAAILGGAKVSDKIGVISNLMEKVNTLIIGGGMAYTFLKAQGYQIGKSLCEDDKLDLARELLEKAAEKGVNLLLPVDNICAEEISETAIAQYVDGNNIPDNLMGLDIGEKTIALFKGALANCKTIVWNGPVGYSELPQFGNGTKELAKLLSELEGAITVVGGGDSASAVKKLGLSDKFTHISTGGGASLEFLEGKKLPGVECLENK